MNGSMFRTSLLATLALALAVPAAAALEAPGAAPDLDRCERAAPPCGYIWPTIGLEPDIQVPYPTSKLPELPREVEIKVTYYWDMEQDGTGLPGDTEEMKLTFIVSKEPQWLDASLEPPTCSFRLLPHQTHYDVCTLTLTLEPVLHPDLGLPQWPMTEEQLDDYGKRVMVFASSQDSGTFKKSYGVEDLRFKFDEAPVGGAPILGTEDLGREVAEESPALAVPAMAAVLGLAALLRRRR